jgi:TrpR-related protein YerC/YecD
MSKPKSEVDQKEYFKEIHFLYEIINNLKNVEEIKPFLKDILTSSELRMLKRRWHIANLLIEGNDIRTVAMKSKTSTQTVSKIKKILEEGHGGLANAIERSFEKQKKDREKYLKSIKHKGGSKFIKGMFD